MNGIEIKKLKVFSDERGCLFEILRNVDEVLGKTEIAQVTVGVLKPGITKAWHMHKEQTDHITILKGKALLGLANGKETEKIFLDEKKPELVKISPGIWHGIKALEGEAVILYIMNKTYNPEDEFRKNEEEFEKGFWESKN